MKKVIEYLINILDYYHQKKIVKYLKDKKIQIVIDVGAHKGEYIGFIKKLNPKKIYAFEPQKKIFKFLKSKYKKSKKIEMFNICISNKKKKRTFYLNELSSTSSLMKTNNKSLWGKFKKIILNKKDILIEKIIIDTNTLDNILLPKLNAIDNILLKIDVEGAEYDVLRGAKKIINNKNVSYIQIEEAKTSIYNKKNHMYIKNFLEQNGYKKIKSFLFPTMHFSDDLYMRIK